MAEMQLSEGQKKDLMELQALQQQLQIVLMQKQQLLLQQTELDKAQGEVEKASGQMYRFAGSILVAKDKASLEKELKEEKESADMRVNSLGKQEKKLKDRFEELRRNLEKSFPKQGLGGEGAITS